MSDGFGKGLLALVVDDEQTVRKLLKEVLTTDGFTVEVATSLKAASELCAKSTFDLVIVDKNLPDGSGLTLAQQLFEKSHLCAVMLITGYASLDSAIRALQLHVADYLVKPIDIKDLRDRIQRVVEYLELRRQHRELIQQMQRQNLRIEKIKAGGGSKTE